MERSNTESGNWATAIIRSWESSRITLVSPVCLRMACTLAFSCGMSSASDPKTRIAYLSFLLAKAAAQPVTVDASSSSLRNAPRANICKSRTAHLPATSSSASRAWPSHACGPGEAQKSASKAKTLLQMWQLVRVAVKYQTLLPKAKLAVSGRCGAACGEAVLAGPNYGSSSG
eukprot:m.914783 g.914783  ORF g.914783 m.914783 type:complete len:173 (+) comp60142_c0_seq17:4857-5375(+)